MEGVSPGAGVAHRGSMYSVHQYGRMIMDELRMKAYADALRQAITPDSVVIDIGTGTGILALLACRFGARRVYAIEPCDAVHVAREIAVANGYAERIEFMQARSVDVSPPERADVIVSDLRGVLPLGGQHLPAIIDARARLLKPGGTLIPQSDTVWAAVVDAADVYRHYAHPWRDDGLGLDLSAALPAVMNNAYSHRVAADQLLADPQCWATIEYADVAGSDVSAELAWVAGRAGTAHGISVWFDTVLLGEARFSNAPDEPELIYGSAFFPLERPVPVAAGDAIAVTLRADLVGDDYLWRWNTRVLAQGRPGRTKAAFEQSTFTGQPLNTHRLRKRGSNYVPTLDADGEVERAILILMDGRTPLGDIARRIAHRFPDRFANWYEAVAEVGRVSLRFARDDDNPPPPPLIPPGRTA